MKRRSVAGLITLFVTIGFLVCADGLFGGVGNRLVVFQCSVLVLATLYVGTVLFHGGPAVAAGDLIFVFILAILPMLASALLVLPFLGASASWIPFVICPLITVVLWNEFRRMFEKPRHVFDCVQSAVLAIWVTAGGILVLGLLLRLPYITALQHKTVFRGLLDVRALLVVSILIPTAVRAALGVRVSSSVFTPNPAPELPAETWRRLLWSFVAPIVRLTHLLYRILRYITAVVLAWSKSFAEGLRALVVDIDAYKASGQMLLVYSAYVLLALSSRSMAVSLTAYLRTEAPWAGGALRALGSAVWISGGIVELLLLALLISAALEQLNEERVIAAAELLGWAIVSSACASVILWLAQHYSPLQMVGFVSPGVVTALLAVAVLVYLVRLFRVAGKTAGKTTQVPGV